MFPEERNHPGWDGWRALLRRLWGGLSVRHPSPVLAVMTAAAATGGGLLPVFPILALIVSHRPFTVLEPEAGDAHAI